MAAAQVCRYWQCKREEIVENVPRNVGRKIRLGHWFQVEAKYSEEFAVIKLDQHEKNLTKREVEAMKECLEEALQFITDEAP